MNSLCFSGYLVLKSQNRRAVVTATKKEKTKANKMLAPLEFQICLQQISRLAFGAGEERRMLISEQRRRKGWQALGGAQPGSTSGKRKQSSGEPSGRAGRQPDTGKGAGLTAWLGGETSGRPTGSGSSAGGGSRPCREGRGRQQRRSSISGD